MIAERWDISREDMERFALQSHTRAFATIAEGRFDNEIIDVDGFQFDECREVLLEKMLASRPWRSTGFGGFVQRCSTRDLRAARLRCCWPPSRPSRTTASSRAPASTTSALAATTR